MPSSCPAHPHPPLLLARPPRLLYGAATSPELPCRLRAQAPATMLSSRRYLHRAAVLQRATTPPCSSSAFLPSAARVLVLYTLHTPCMHHHSGEKAKLASLALTTAGLRRRADTTSLLGAMRQWPRRQAVPGPVAAAVGRSRAGPQAASPPHRHCELALGRLGAVVPQLGLPSKAPSTACAAAPRHGSCSLAQATARMHALLCRCYSSHPPPLLNLLISCESIKRPCM